MWNDEEEEKFCLMNLESGRRVLKIASGAPQPLLSTLERRYQPRIITVEIKQYRGFFRARICGDIFNGGIASDE